MTVRNGTQVVGGLAVNPVKRGPAGEVAAIVGLVCVAPEHRGRGYSQLALMTAISHAGRLGTDDMVLWTGNPGIYENLGFKPCDSASFGTVKMHEPAWKSMPPAIRSAWPDAKEERGLPSFATEAYR